MSTHRATLVPVLPSVNLDRSLAHYRYLGFRVLEHAEDYARLAWSDAELHIYRQPELDPAANCIGCYVRVTDPQALRATWAGDGVECLDMSISSHYGPTAFAVVDPDGNTLRIGPSTDPAP
ncbi:MAG TPA: hypothetical protein VGZ32_02085 [Actinocrinis sp.]|jgi:catechol 2,3-dioxygenase-like lactoylglutathione lyase family enzyme|uniref:hypothetical protein n=1 Tax=Actinocrinis sp. TaxID=1920516 RepID=UPI002DDD5C24|nr:hypothetical protein [Actinocrinis sp.]HEV3169095.1 hypothetical protein [Actinocrinis sp.]